LSSEIKNGMSALSSSILENDEILERSIQDKQVTNINLNRIGLNYIQIKENYIRLKEIIRHIDNNFYKNLNSETTIILEEFSSYISMDILKNYRNEYKIIKDEKTVNLTDEQIYAFEIMQKINSEWAKTIKENVKGATPVGMEQVYWDSYKNAIKHNY